MQFLMPFIKSGKQQQGNLLIPPELENNSNIDDTQEGLNDEMRSNHEQGLSKISHGAKTLKPNNKLNDFDSCFMEYFERKKNITTTSE